MPATPVASHKSFFAQWKPYLIGVGVSIAICIEVAVIAYLSEGNSYSGRGRLSLPKTAQQSSSSLSKSSDQRIEDTTNMKDEVPIHGNVLNPVESAFSEQKQLDQAQKVGLE
ncbi:MAG: hypothetical protein ACKO6N_07145 [Myxococcota bacterium]